MSSDKDPPSVVPPKHDAEIGRVARSWGHLEYVIDLTTWELGDFVHQFGACVTSQLMSIHPKLNAMISLVILRGGSEKLIKELRKFQGGLSGLVDLRNRAVHDARMVRQSDPNTVCRFQNTAKPTGVVFDFVPESVEELKEISTRIRAEINRFYALRKKIAAELAALSDKPPLQFRRIVDLSDSEEPTS